MTIYITEKVYRGDVADFKFVIILIESFGECDKNLAEIKTTWLLNFSLKFNYTNPFQIKLICFIITRLIFVLVN